MSAAYVFVHGWGESSRVWDLLKAEMSAKDAQCIDLGFIDVLEEKADVETKHATFITHSLGTMWALKKYTKNTKALIAINGFYSFHDFADPKTLEAMKVRLKRSPRAQMNDFWTTAGLPFGDSMNEEKLMKGLEWLQNWNLERELQSMKTPIMVLGGDEDKVLPISLMSKHWQNYHLRVCEGGGHALPISHPKWC